MRETAPDELDGEEGEGEEEFDALEQLERQHAENQRQAAAIRAELGLG